jgi:hypothetical protein
MVAQVWLTITSVLATFHIHKSKDDTGSEEEVETAYTDGATRCLLTFHSCLDNANRIEQSPRVQMYSESTV